MWIYRLWLNLCSWHVRLLFSSWAPVNLNKMGHQQCSNEGLLQPPCSKSCSAMMSSVSCLQVHFVSMIYDIECSKNMFLSRDHHMWPVEKQGEFRWGSKKGNRNIMENKGKNKKKICNWSVKNVMHVTNMDEMSLLITERMGMARSDTGNRQWFLCSFIDSYSSSGGAHQKTIY